MPSKNRGFLLIGAVILILLIGSMGVYVAHIATTNDHSAALYRDMSGANSVANSALSEVTQSLVGPDLSQRVSCEDLASHYQTTALGEGEFQVTGTRYYSSNPNTLTKLLLPTDNIIHVSSLSGFAPYGRVRINKEFLDYTGTSNDAANCNNEAPCLTGAKHGTAFTSATSHNEGTLIGQNQCSVRITAAVPSFNNEIARHTLNAQILSLDEGWLVSRQPARALAIFRFNGASFEKFTSAEFGSGVDPKHTNAISQLNYPTGYFGANRAGKINFMQWNGNQIVRMPNNSVVPSTSITDISCLSDKNCWATGKDGNLLRYDSTDDWHNARPEHTLDFKDNPTYGIVYSTTHNGQKIKVSLYGISCSTSNSCWAVGTVYDDKPIYEYYNGDKWRRVSKYVGEINFGPANFDRNILRANTNGVFCTSSHNCWSVGAVRDSLPNINHYNGTTWSRYEFPEDSSQITDLARNLNDVYCTSSSNCWLVGQNGGTGNFRNTALIAHYNGSTWTRQTIPSNLPNQSLDSIYCAYASNCWAAGNSGTLLHYNGSNWSAITPPADASRKRLSDFSIISVPHQLPAFIKDN